MPAESVLNAKKAQVAELAEKMQKAASGVLVDYRGLTVEEDTELRTAFRNAGVDYKVVKNTLTRLAANEVGYGELDPFLNGPSSLAMSYDEPVAAAKVVVEFSKKYEALEIKAGFVDGKVVDVAGIKSLAELPSKEVLVAQVLGGLNAPISGLANVLNGTIRGLAVALGAIQAQKEA